MSTWGDKLGIGGTPVGVGISLPPIPVVEPQPIIYSSFASGLITADAPEHIPESAGQAATDVRVDTDDSLIRQEGTSLDEDVTPRDLTYLFQHASLDFSTELVAIDPPFLGYKGSSTFTFVDLTLAATGSKGWNVLNVAGVLLFSNGIDATYTRQPNAAIVTDISADIIADTFATCFGRVFAGAYTDAIGGYQGLGIAWNGTNTPPEEDWISANAGAELLLANQQEADRIIALRSIGFDALCILTRKAIWFGYQTGLDNHPAQFKLRWPGRGCVAEATACATPHGVIFLGDEGVILVDLNNARNVSTQINSELVPLNFVLLANYRATYDSIRDRYVLVTPFGTWYYEFERENPFQQGATIPARWFFSSFIPRSVVTFTSQNTNVYWNTVQGTWAQQTLTWAEMSVGELNAPPILYFGLDSELGFEDPLAFDNLGMEQDPHWITKQSAPKPSDQYSTIWFEIEYATLEDAVVEFAVADKDTNFTYIKSVLLPSTAGVRRSGVFPFQGTGKGTAVSIRYTSKNAKIWQVTQTILPAGPAQMSLA